MASSCVDYTVIPSYVTGIDDRYSPTQMEAQVKL